MASALSHLSPMSVRMREGWSDDGRREEQVEDEFACSGALRGALRSFHPSVERIFGVSFTIGREEDAVLPHDGQIWLRLKGVRKNAVAAKLFVKGVVNQEAQQEVPYPGVLHCVFCGARGLFMECLIRNTSAYILVGSPGFLLISGLAEPVVRAYSLITDLVKNYEGTQGRRTEPGDRGSGETLDSRRAFKSLVERWEDRHTLDLLVLPGVVKETLLDLVRESGLGSNPGPGGSNLSLGGSRDRVGLMDTDSQRQWDSQSGLDILTLMDTRVGTRAGEARDIVGMQGISTSRSKPPINSTHNQDPGLRNIGQLSQQKTLTTLHVQEREMSKDWSQGGIGKDAAPQLPIFHSFLQTEEEGQGSSQQEVEDEEQGEEGQGEMLLSVGSREEFGLLLKFFTAMGYAEDEVMRVLAQTGPREASQILDLVQQEHDRTGLAMNCPVEMEHTEVEEREGKGVRGKRSGIDGGMGVELEGGVEEGVRSREEGRKGRESGGSTVNLSEDSLEEGRERGEGGMEGVEGGNEEDFVLGVVKRAAASCGYTEEKVAEVYSMLPELSTRQLLLELQREGARETEAASQDQVRDEPREVDEVVSELQRKDRAGDGEEERGREMEAPVPQSTVTEKRGEERKSVKGKSERKTDEVGVTVSNRIVDGTDKVEPDLAQWNAITNQVPFLTHSHQKNPTRTHTPHRASPPLVRGPPQPTYPNTLPPQPTYPNTLLPQPTYPNTLLAQPTYPLLFPHQLVYPPTQPPQTTLPPTLTMNNSSATRAKEKRGLFPLAAEGRDLPALTAEAVDRRGLPTMAAGAVVTGQQRFMEGLQTPFDLKLTDQPGDPGLRMVIIDGSNVAMSHGLGHFFSCRGIALAVQHFWNRGHRRISTFLPQWRQKRDHRGKEQHYLSELQNLGLLSYTPSREVQGKRINSYDDRFMLQLAQKTDGVIVTNDNLRDLLDESHVWREIIKKRLLQYTFVGDHFMVPDDPLGRGGPHLDDFLHSQHRPLVPGSHSFAGVSSSFHSPRAPRAQTEVLQFRDWTPGVVVEPEPSQARGNGQARAGPGGLGLGVKRSAEETSRIRESLSQVFPGQDSMVTLVLQCNPTVTDINSLSHFILEQGGVD
ncbi:protein KHNYN [Salmo trutta]|uniref:KH and NYN domain containing n=1 Tax=Salmo trutta TaxID=8032 RepID=A0A673WC76_SALTR|nr:protein KHNYN-like [Salmo trutta]XP_029610262.1 protein KHNYN-like [Salmo trutta]